MSIGITQTGIGNAKRLDVNRDQLPQPEPILNPRPQPRDKRGRMPNLGRPHQLISALALIPAIIIGSKAASTAVLCPAKRPAARAVDPLHGAGSSQLASPKEWSGFSVVNFQMVECCCGWHCAHQRDGSVSHNNASDASDHCRNNKCRRTVL